MPIIGDIAAGPPFILVGVIYGAIVLAIVTLAEGAALRLLGWGTFARSLRDALLVNLASAIVGIVMSALAQERAAGYDPERGGRLYDAPLVAPALALLIAWALSVAIEGALLLRLGGQPPRRTWTAAVVINVVSYLLLLGFVYVVGDV